MSFSDEIASMLRANKGAWTDTGRAEQSAIESIEQKIVAAEKAMADQMMAEVSASYYQSPPWKVAGPIQTAANEPMNASLDMISPRSPLIGKIVGITAPPPLTPPSGSSYAKAPAGCATLADFQEWFLAQPWQAHMYMDVREWMWVRAYLSQKNRAMDSYGEYLQFFQTRLRPEFDGAPKIGEQQPDEPVDPTRPISFED